MAGEHTKACWQSKKHSRKKRGGTQDEDDGRALVGVVPELGGARDEGGPQAGQDAEDDAEGSVRDLPPQVAPAGDGDVDEDGVPRDGDGICTGMSISFSLAVLPQGMGPCIENAGAWILGRIPVDELQSFKIPACEGSNVFMAGCGGGEGEEGGRGFRCHGCCICWRSSMQEWKL